MPGNLLNCMTKHCKIYCDAVKDPETTAIAECPIFDWIIPGPEVAISFIKCRETNEKYKPCTVINNPKWWKHCGELFSVAGQGYNTGSANANKSNYPFPACQVDIFSGTVLCDLTGEFCCVECRMRSCCATGSFNDFLKRLMIDDIKTHCFRRRF